VRQLVTVRIDQDDYIQLKAQGVVISEILRTYIKEYVHSQQQDLPDLDVLKEEHDHLLQQKKDVDARLLEVTTKISIAKGNDQKKMAEYWAEKEKAKLFNKGLRNARFGDFD
jgi:hypothetical protein